MPPNTVILLLIIFLLSIAWYLFIKFKASPKIKNLTDKTFDAPPEDITKEVKTRVARRRKTINIEKESLQQQQAELDSFVKEKPVNKRKPRKFA